LPIRQGGVIFVLWKTINGKNKNPSFLFFLLILLSILIRARQMPRQPRDAKLPKRRLHQQKAVTFAAPNTAPDCST